jgi:hypothetical protein
MPKRATKATDENDFDALEKLARGVTLEKLRPMNAEERKRWERARSSGLKSRTSNKPTVATVVLLDPKLVARVDAYARRAGISRSQAFDRSLRRALRATE